MKTILFVACAALAGCTQASDGNQSASNERAEQPIAETVATNDSAVVPTGSATGTSKSGAVTTSTTVSSGMPVPGTNTPEHIVVNEVANSSANRL